MHGRGDYPGFLVVGPFINFDEILVNNIEEPEVIAGSQLRMTRNKVKVLPARIYAEATAMAFDHIEVVKPYKRLAAVMMLVSNEEKVLRLGQDLSYMKSRQPSILPLGDTANLKQVRSDVCRAGRP